MLNSDQWLGRRFQLWDYSPSLSRLLIRSPRRGDHQLNIDIVFLGVDYLSLRPILREIFIEVEDTPDKNTKKFLIKSVDETYVVIASNCVVSYSDTDIFDSPLNKL
jgi:hypothetical protein